MARNGYLSMDYTRSVAKALIILNLSSSFLIMVILYSRCNLMIMCLDLIKMIMVKDVSLASLNLKRISGHSVMSFLMTTIQFGTWKMIG